MSIDYATALLRYYTTWLSWKMHTLKIFPSGNTVYLIIGAVENYSLLQHPNLSLNGYAKQTDLLSFSLEEIHRKFNETTLI